MQFHKNPNPINKFNIFIVQGPAVKWDDFIT
jgi:hypothetical protein